MKKFFPKKKAISINESIKMNLFHGKNNNIFTDREPIKKFNPFKMKFIIYTVINCNNYYNHYMFI